MYKWQKQIRVINDWKAVSLRDHAYFSYSVFISIASLVFKLSIHHCKTSVSPSKKFAKTHAAISSNNFRFKEF